MLISGGSGHHRRVACGLAVAAVAALSGCGGSSAKVGDCIDSGKHVVDCKSKSATEKLVSKQSGSTAIACIQIDTPQTQVKVDGKTFCAERK